MDTKETIRWQDFEVRVDVVGSVFEILEENGYKANKDYGYFGHGEMITEITDRGEWKLFPSELYDKTIPPWAMQRVSTLINAGIHIKGLVIADDIKRYTEQPEKPKPFKLPNLPDVSKIVQFVLGVIGVAAAAVAWGVFFLAMACLSLLSIDPYLVVVCEDSSWIYVAEFFN
jgi:hypothetical protein